MRYFKIMVYGATLCCIETEIEINFSNVCEVLKQLGFTEQDFQEEENEPIEKIIEIDKEEAYEWYDVTQYNVKEN